MLQNRFIRLAVIAAIGTAAFAATQPRLSFEAPRLQPLADVPSRVAVGDFNGDGKTDLVSISSVQGSLSISLGRGDGTFRQGAQYNIGSEPYSVAVADFNGDGKPDLAVGFLYGGISILLGNGDGTFQPPVSITVGSQPSFVAVGDFNGDGNKDVALTDYTAADVWILLGNGDGTLQPAVGYPVGPYYPLQVVVKDFDRDGKQDLAVSYLASGGVSVLSGNGDGSFQPQVFYAAGQSGGFLAVADFNGDGNPDLALAGSEIYVLLGNGDGTFAPAIGYAGAPLNGSLATGDFNGDGNPDLAATCGTGVDRPGSVAILLGSGHGGMPGTGVLPVGFNGKGVKPYQMAVGDFNGDGNQDLAVADGAGAVQILLGNGDGTFQSAMNYTVTGIAVFVLAGDFNGDGISDLAVLSSSSSQKPQTISILLGNKDGTLQPGATYTLPLSESWLAAGDFNGDGKLDLVVNALGAIQGLYLMLGNGDGTFQAPVNTGSSVGGFQFLANDFNGDGKLDLALFDYANIYILLGNGNGTFQPPITNAVSGGQGSIAAGDFNGDGIPDVVVGGETSRNSSSVSILLGNGDGTFRPGGSQAMLGEIPSVAVGDFIGGGKLDVVVTSDLMGAVAILLGNGDGTLMPPAYFGGGLGPIQVVVGDFTGDRQPGLAVLDRQGPIQILLEPRS